MKLTRTTGLCRWQRRKVLAALAENARAKDGVPFASQPIAWCFHHRFQQIAALDGERIWNWLYIDTLWVHEKHRRQGLGTALMQAAESYARQQSLTGIYLWTQSWEAPGFYEKLGFERFVTFDNFPHLHQRYGYRKYLSLAKK